MPEVLSIRQIALEFADLYRRKPIERPPQPLSRFPGPHQSDILAFIARKIGKLKPGERLEEEMPWRMALGVMWEEFYFSLHPDRIWQPGEQVVDGVAANPDGLGTITHVDVPEGMMDSGEYWNSMEETKATSKKAIFDAAELLEAFSDGWWMWQHQVRTYCHVYGVEVVRWSNMHLHGNYVIREPIAVEYIVRFTEEECRGSWAMVQKWKHEAWKALGHKEGYEDDVPF